MAHYFRNCARSELFIEWNLVQLVGFQKAVQLCERHVINMLAIQLRGRVQHVSRPQDPSGSKLITLYCKLVLQVFGTSAQSISVMRVSKPSCLSKSFTFVVHPREYRTESEMALFGQRDSCLQQVSVPGAAWWAVHED